MTTVSPKRVSMYDFLSQDLQPTVSLLADATQLSLPQTRLGLSASLQAIITALLAYEQRNQASVVHKKLFTRGSVKELRQYNAMNFATISASLYHRNDVTDAIFGDAATVMKACHYIAEQISARPMQVKTLLTSLSILVLRELAVLADYSQLDSDELAKWFELQPQFLSIASIDDYWYTLTQFQAVQTAPVQGTHQATPKYIKAIGRAPENVQQGRHNDMLVFEPMANIVLPHQRWLLQLAKIADIYLSRNRLRITSEPATAPIAPLVSIGLLGVSSDDNDDTQVTTREQPIKHDKSVPLWKNPVILIIILVIGVLGGLAMLKYQQQQSDGVLTASDAVYEHNHPNERQQQDMATVKVDESIDNNNGARVAD